MTRVEKKTKMSRSYKRETKWIRRICFFIPALVLSLSLIILKNFLIKTKRSWAYMREKRLDSPYLFLHCVFSSVCTSRRENKMLKRVCPHPVDFCIRFWSIYQTILHRECYRTLRYISHCKNGGVLCPPNEQHTIGVISHWPRKVCLAHLIWCARS